VHIACVVFVALKVCVYGLVDMGWDDGVLVSGLAESDEWTIWCWVTCIHMMRWSMYRHTG